MGQRLALAKAAAGLSPFERVVKRLITKRKVQPQLWGALLSKRMEEYAKTVKCSSVQFAGSADDCLDLLPVFKQEILAFAALHSA